jgi:uncharacterized protein (TIGR02466 family)
MNLDMEMEMETQHLFAIPIIKSKSRYLFNENEIYFINNVLETKKNIGNIVSIDKNILEHTELENVKKFIEMGIQNYVNNVISPSNKNIEFYITQSWANYTDTGNFHHKHTHPNSLISGCLYVNADKNVDTITFYNPHPQYKRISIPCENYNIYNSESWWIPIETGQLILFDSSIEHMVENTKSTETRISISFNVFVRGELGYDSGAFFLRI